MKLTHISPEFLYTPVNGTLSMKEKKSFFGSKLVKFASQVSVLNENIIWYQNVNGEQLNLNAEVLLGPNIYDTNSDKLANHNLVLNNSQTNEQLNSNTSWILTINYGKILQNYLFATLKKWRTFSGVTDTITLNNDVDYAMNEYITDNLLGIYELKKVDLFISYNNLSSTNRYNPSDTSVNLLQRKNLFDDKIATSTNLINKFNSTIDNIKMVDTITFTQEKSSSDWNFNYYFNLYFSKI
jgi:hypothetical protein